MRFVIDVDGNNINLDSVISLLVSKYQSPKSGRKIDAYRIVARQDGRIIPLTFYHTNKSLVLKTFYKMEEALESGVEFIDPMEIMRELSE